MKKFMTCILSLFAAPLSAQPIGAAAPSPGEIVSAAPRHAWVQIPADELLVMDLAPDGQGKTRRVVIQLMPWPFSQPWVANIRTLAAAHFWDGLSINRVQDNYVVQWGDADAEHQGKAKPLPQDMVRPSESDYVIQVRWGQIIDPVVHGYEAQPGIAAREGPINAPRAIAGASADEAVAQPELRHDSYVDATGFYRGWPMAGERKPSSGKDRRRSDLPGHLLSVAWPVHCYGMVGVGRDMSPDTGSGAELYTVIGHAPRHLDRNIALVGRVIEGIEHLSSLPRGTGPLGFYETAEERTPILTVRIGTEVADLPAYEYLSTDSASFATYADARANRRDPFFIRPAGGADICNVPVPVRRKEA